MWRQRKLDHKTHPSPTDGFAKFTPDYALKCGKFAKHINQPLVNQNAFAVRPVRCKTLLPVMNLDDFCSNVSIYELVNGAKATWSVLHSPRTDVHTLYEERPCPEAEKQLEAGFWKGFRQLDLVSLEQNQPGLLVGAAVRGV